MDELEEIRQKKLERLRQLQQEDKQQTQEQDQHGQQMRQQLEMLEGMVKQKLTKQALERYGNIKTGHPDKAVQLLLILGQAMQTQNIETIDDEQLKQILMRMEPPKKDTKITRK